LEKSLITFGSGELDRDAVRHLLSSLSPSLGSSSEVQNEAGRTASRNQGPML